jgi:hypothetical protein
MITDSNAFFTILSTNATLQEVMLKLYSTCLLSFQEGKVEDFYTTNHQTKKVRKLTFSDRKRQL